MGEARLVSEGELGERVGSWVSEEDSGGWWSMGCASGESMRPSTDEPMGNAGTSPRLCDTRSPTDTIDCW